MAILSTNSSLKDLFTKTQGNLTQPWILVDSSYVCYYSAASAWNWFKKEYGIEDDYSFNPIKENDYKMALEKKLRNNIKYSVINAGYKVPNFKKVIFALDCPKDEIWRNGIYEEYKLQRKIRDKSKDAFDYKPVFKYIRDIFIPNYCEENDGAKYIGVPTAEGDDIIATIVKTLPEEDDKVIIASDHDYAQLFTIPNIKVINLRGELLTLESESQIKPLQEAEYILTPKDVLLKKILTGDVADNIKGIFRGCGPVKAAKFILDKKLLKAKLQEPEVKAQFDLNCQLIDFDNIPEELTEEIIRVWKNG